MNFRVQESSLFGGKTMNISYLASIVHYIWIIVVFKTTIWSKLGFIFACALPLLFSPDISKFTVYLLQTSIVIHLLCIRNELKRVVK